MPVEPTLSPCVIVEGVFSLDMQNSVTVKEGDSLSLTCKVNGGQGRLSVAWQRNATTAQAAASVIGLNQDGVVEKGSEFAGRRVRAARPATDTFTLELDGVTASDAGVYLCVVSKWKVNSTIIIQSASSTVTVALTGELRLQPCRTNHPRIFHVASCMFHAPANLLLRFRVIPEAQAHGSKQQGDRGRQRGADM